MSDYWVKRALERMRRAELLADNYEARIFRLYQEAFDELNGELKALFEYYASQGGLTPIEAAQYLREPVTRAQADAILQKLAEVADPDVRRKLLAQANSAQISARMKRIQAMQENVQAECAKIADKEIAIHQEAARKVGEEAYYRTVFDVQQGVKAAVPFAQITIDQIDAVLSQKWAGVNYSARVWQNAELMADKLGEIVRANVATGRPWERCVDEMQQYMMSPDQGGRYAATRLLRTETMHVYNEMSAEASSALGAERYRYIAVLDLKTSEICRLHDGLIDPDTGKAYTYADRKPGKNFPPLHPWCRSIEAPYIDEATLEEMTRPAKDPVTGKIIEVPATMTYQEWHKEYVEGNDQAKVNERMIQNTVGDRAQLQRYREVLGKDALKDLAAFQRMKYTDAVGFEQLEWDYRFEKKHRATDESELLVNRGDAVGINEKLTTYSLSMDHPRGKHKARVFDSALGYTGFNVDVLENEITAGLAKYKAAATGNNGFGNTFDVTMLITGPKGKQPINTGWIFRDGEVFPRMVTAYVDKPQRP
ncbi:MAG TPA: minor capsid protein [Clostridia bacterium]|nr:minor capsid protein [Clostridia bacterium]